MDTKQHNLRSQFFRLLWLITTTSSEREFHFPIPSSQKALMYMEALVF